MEILQGFKITGDNMKKILLALAVICLLLPGCKLKTNDKDNKIQDYRESHYGITKTMISVDTALFRKEIERLLPPEEILAQFGSGYHNFYMTVSNRYGSVPEFILCTEAPFFDRNGGGSPVGLMNASEKTARRDKRGNSYNESRIAAEYIFDKYYPDERNIFKFDWKAPDSVKPTENDMSIHLFEINLIIDKNGRVIKPWTLNKADMAKFSSHFSEKGVNRYYYSTGLPAVSIDGFESIKKIVKYPEEAQKNGVTGRVVVEIFADGEGNFSGYHLIKGLGYGCDDAVINAIKAAKFKAYPTGQRSSIIVPFEFGPAQTSPIDLAVGYFNYNSDPNVYNNINLAIVNKNKLDRNVDKEYFVYVYVNKHLVFQTICRSILKSDLQQQYWFRFDEKKPGTYDYAVYIDPENRLNDSNIENNILRGTLVIR